MRHHNIVSMLYKQMLTHRGYVEQVDYEFGVDTGYRESYRILSFPNSSVRYTMTVHVYTTMGAMSGELQGAARQSQPIYTMGQHAPVEMVPGAFIPAGEISWPGK